MDENNQPIIDLPASSSTVTKNRFPIVIQLVVIGVLLGGIFMALASQDAVQGETPIHRGESVVPDEKLTIGSDPRVVPLELADVSVVARAVYVYDVRAGRALYSKNAGEILPLASITKLMTALVAHELIAETERAAVPLSAIMQEGNSGLMAGEELSIAELQRLALISSSNDAAHTLAASVGSLLGGDRPTELFVAGMNIRAKELGLDTLQFKNATGLDLTPQEPGAVGSARDVTFLIEHILGAYPEVLSPTTQVATRVYNTAGAYHEVENTNDIVDAIPNLIASKTGYTDLAGGNLTVAFDIGFDRPIIVTVLGSTRQDRFSDVLALTRAVQESVREPSMLQ